MTFIAPQSHLQCPFGDKRGIPPLSSFSLPIQVTVYNKPSFSPLFSLPHFRAHLLPLLRLELGFFSFYQQTWHLKGSFRFVIPVGTFYLQLSTQALPLGTLPHYYQHRRPHRLQIYRAITIHTVQQAPTFTPNAKVIPDTNCIR